MAKVSLALVTLARSKALLSSIFLTIGLALLGGGALSQAVSTYAGDYWGWHTGYAMGNLYGDGNVVLYPTDFANHSYVYCPGDPAAYWPYWTEIREDQSIGFHTSSGYLYYATDMTLLDWGDPTCSMGNYWVDVYFGRWYRQGEPCTCPGVPDGQCYLAQANSCDDALDFGVQWRGYIRLN